MISFDAHSAALEWSELAGSQIRVQVFDGRVYAYGTEAALLTLGAAVPSTGRMNLSAQRGIFYLCMGI